MKIRSLLPICLVGTLTLFSSCEKGDPGEPGKDGNANVKAGIITFSSWTWDDSFKYSYSDFTWPTITSSIVDSGALLIYVQTTSGAWAQLPRTIYPSESYSESQRFNYNVGAFRIIVQDSDLKEPLPLGTWTIRVITIAASIRKANPHLDWSNYDEVKAALRIRD
jgi:hypothetical protein